MEPNDLKQLIKDRALALGADAAGIASWAEVRAGPSRAIQPHLSSYEGVGVSKAPAASQEMPQPGSLLVVALAHPTKQLALDWWQSHLARRTMGNHILVEITQGVAAYLESQHEIKAWDLPYYPGRGGVFLKDAAVLAGLGCVGRNNLFLAPEHGPRLRLRAMALETQLPSDPRADYDPCSDCAAPCRQACPQEAMSAALYQDLPGLTHLPARDGSYDRLRCNQQMQADIAVGRQITPPGQDQPAKQVRYCRRCELVCLAGRGAN